MLGGSAGLADAGARWLPRTRSACTSAATATASLVPAIRAGLGCPMIQSIWPCSCLRPVHGHGATIPHGRHVRMLEIPALSRLRPVHVHVSVSALLATGSGAAAGWHKWARIGDRAMVMWISRLVGGAYDRGIQPWPGALVLVPARGQVPARRNHCGDSRHNLPMAMVGTLIWLWLVRFHTASTSETPATVAIAIVAMQHAALVGRGPPSPPWHSLVFVAQARIGMACNGMAGRPSGHHRALRLVRPAAAVLIGALAGPLVVLVVNPARAPPCASTIRGRYRGSRGLWCLGCLGTGTSGRRELRRGWNGVAGPAAGLSVRRRQSISGAIDWHRYQCDCGFSRWPYAFFRLLDRVMGKPRVPSEVEWTGLRSLEMGSTSLNPHA